MRMGFNTSLRPGARPAYTCNAWLSSHGISWRNPTAKIDLPAWLAECQTVGWYRVGRSFSCVGYGRPLALRSSAVCTAVQLSKTCALADHCQRGRIQAQLRNDDNTRQLTVSLNDTVHVGEVWSAAKSGSAAHRKLLVDGISHQSFRATDINLRLDGSRRKRTCLYNI